MKIKELKKILNQSSHQDEEEVQVILSIPSLGPRATSKVKDVSFGFDWDKGLLIHTENPLVIKNDKQSIFEESYSLLMKIATESFIVKKETKTHQEAKRVLNKMGISNEVIKSYIHLYHK
jgi:hypothetical protein